MFGSSPRSSQLTVFALILALAGGARGEDLTAHVDPFIGTGAHGHTYPGATVPFGAVQLSPDTHTKSWDWCSGYHFSDSSVIGFSHTHLSGAGAGDLVHGIDDQPTELELEIKGQYLVTGLRRSAGWARDHRVYFAAEFSRPFDSFGTALRDDAPQSGQRSARGKHVKGFVLYRTRPGEVV